jgi:hypothetical protein
MQELVIPSLPELTFDEKAHRYLLNGVEIPSVTSLMGPLSQKEYGEIPQNILTKAADKGTAVHEAIEEYSKFGIADIAPEYQGYLDGFMKWENAMKPEVIGSEVRTYHRILGYAGTADCIAVIDGELNLIDFKTTYKVIEKSCRVQLEAYAQALDSHGIKIVRKRILHLKKDGEYKEYAYPEKDIEAWSVFGALKCIHDYMN